MLCSVFWCSVGLSRVASDGEVKRRSGVEPGKFMEHHSVCRGELELVYFKIVYVSKIE